MSDIFELNWGNFGHTLEYTSIDFYKGTNRFNEDLQCDDWIREITYFILLWIKPELNALHIEKMSCCLLYYQV